MTDLPYLDCIRPVIAMIGPPEHIALLSLPMLSLMRAAHPADGSGPRRDRSADLAVRHYPATREIQYTSEAPHVRGRLRLLGGMVRVNRPWLCCSPASPERSLACSPPRRSAS